ncbi:hypothetical protein KR038_007924, partial [Drosophila bunnanda]
TSRKPLLLKIFHITSENMPKACKKNGKDQKDLIKQLIKCQKDINKINKMTCDEILDVEDKYEGLRKPLYKKRNEAIKRIPNFWATSLINNNQIVQHTGKVGLSSIKNLEVDILENIRAGYRIHIHFGENPYFENQVLTKEFRFGNKNGNWIISTNTPIQWKEGKNLVVAKKDSSTLYKSFFDWFLDNTNPNFDHIGGFIKDDLWVNPLRYYCMDPELENNNNEKKQESDEEAKEGDDEDKKEENDDDLNEK